MPTKIFECFNLDESNTYCQLLDENTSLRFSNSASEPTMTKIENWLETSGYDKLWTMMRNNGQPYLNSILIVPKSNAPPVTNFDNSPKLEEKKSIYGPRKQARYPKLEKFAAESLREGAAEPLDPSKL